MDDREIMTRAARLAARHRRRVQTACAVCGRAIEGTVRRRYCSAACKLRAARQRQRHLNSRSAELLARLAAIREELRGAAVGDSAELIREERDKRTAELLAAGRSDAQ